MSIKSALSSLLSTLLGVTGFIVSWTNKSVIYLWEGIMNTKFGFWKYVITAYIVLLVVAAALWFFPTTIGGVAWNWGIEIILLLAIYSMPPWSWETVSPSEKAARYFFGFALDSIGPGLAFVPWGLVQIEKFTNEIQPLEFPDEPGNIYYGSKDDPDGKEVPEGKSSPIRILSGSPSEANNNPYDQQMVIEACGVMIYDIVDPIKYRGKVGPQGKGREKIRAIILDAMIAVLGEELSKDTPEKSRLRFAVINANLKKAIDDITDCWGIDVKSVQLKPYRFSHKLNEAVLEVPKAQREKLAAIIKAEGVKQTLTLEGEGAAAAIQSKLDRETDGRERMAARLKVPGFAILAAETARAVTSNPGQKTVIMGADGFNQLAKVGVVLGETFADAITEKKGV